jgi:hypothetical protein
MMNANMGANVKEPKTNIDIIDLNEVISGSSLIIVAVGIVEVIFLCLQILEMHSM